MLVNVGAGVPDSPLQRPHRPTLGELRAKRDEILRIAASYGAHNVRVFGSVARGDARPDSDVDLLVDIDTDVRGWEFFSLLDDLQQALEDLLGRPVDVGEAIGKDALPSVQRDLVPL